MYSEIVAEHFERPRHQGCLENFDAEGHAGGLRAGPFVRFTARLDEALSIREIGFETFGCAYAVAACSVTAEYLSGNSVAHAAGLTEDALLEKLGGNYPANKLFCLDLAIEAKRALLRALVDLIAGRA